MLICPSCLDSSLLNPSLARALSRRYHSSMIRKLSEEECRRAIAHGEFSAGILTSSPQVAIVLSQSWCPQWLWMHSYLDGLAADLGIAAYWIEYDREPFFDEFLEFKETVLGNREIPYVRYYRNGSLVRESNYIDRGGFLRNLKS